MPSYSPLRHPGRIAWISWMVLLTAAVTYAERVTDVRWGQHEGFSRCVIEFDGDPLRYSLENRISTLGFLYCDLWGASYHSAHGPKPVDDPRVESYQTLYLPSEKRLRYAIKVKGNAVPKIMTLRNPGRLVLDFYWDTPSDAAAKPVSATASLSGGTENRISVSSSSSPRIVSPWTGTGSSTSVASPGGGAVARISPPPPTVRSRRPIIVLDPGHGGYHKGGSGKVGGRTVYEKELTLIIAKKTKEKLEATGRFQVYLTRTRDEYIGLQERTRIAEKFQGDLFVSLHCNAVDGRAAMRRAQGLEFWVWNKNGSTSAASRYIEALENEEDPSSGMQDVDRDTRRLLSSLMVDQLEAEALESRRLCDYLEAAFLKVDYFKKNYRGIKSGRFKVLETYQMPSVLVEMGFLTHPTESKYLASSSFQNLIAQSLCDGIVRMASHLGD